MTNSANIQDNTAGNDTEKGKQSLEQFSSYLQKQHPIVRGLHVVLQIFAYLCMILAFVMFVVAIYYTFVWAFTGETTQLDDAWIRFGLSMSFLVFPWGLDSMLMRVFPAIIFPPAWYRSTRPIRYNTGVGAFFAGFGIMCAGAPGAAYYFGLISQAVQNL